MYLRITAEIMIEELLKIISFKISIFFPLREMVRLLLNTLMPILNQVPM